MKIRWSKDESFPEKFAPPFQKYFLIPISNTSKIVKTTFLLRTFQLFSFLRRVWSGILATPNSSPGRALDV